MEKMVITPEFWKNRKVLITGHTGFKGSWLSIYLNYLGAKVSGYSLAPKSEPNLFTKADISGAINSYIGDICDYQKLDDVVQEIQPDVVFHLAAQSLVRYSYLEPRETFSTNVIGSLNVLEVMKQCSSVKSAIMVTTDKCYENKEWEKPYSETDRLGGFDPYSSSKACAEILIASYRNSFLLDKDKVHGLKVASVRSGNVIGGGDWSEDRLMPDVINAMQAQTELLIRNPKSIRPWMHVLEPLTGYVQLAEKLYEDSLEYEGAWNFGPEKDDEVSVEHILQQMNKINGNTINWKVNGEPQPHEATYLKLDSSKARKKLGWQTKWSLKKSLEKITEWHKADFEKSDIQKICVDQIREYLNT